MTIADGELTALALCWRIERSDGAGIELTSHDRAIVLDGAAYVPTPGTVPAAVTRSVGLDPHSAEIAGALSSDALTETDLALGRWDGGEVRMTAVDWSDPAAAPIAMIGGVLGEVAIDGDGFTAELRGAASRLDEPVCPSTSPECRAQFGDKQCRVDLAGRSEARTLTSASGGDLVLDSAVDSGFLFGRLRYLSGANCGRTTTVLAVTGTTVRVRDIPRGAIEAGCAVELRQGCDKRFQTCVDRFANAANFRGEPHLPGNDLLTRYPVA